MIIKIERIDLTLDLPKKHSEGAAGIDIMASILERDHRGTINEQEGKRGFINLKPGERCIIPTGIKCEIDEGFEVQIRSRSGMAIKKGLAVINQPGTVDFDFRGEILVGIINLSNDVQMINHGDRIAQMVPKPIPPVTIYEVKGLSNTKRGGGGFGSTGY